MMNLDEEKRLIEQAKNGDEGSFETLILSCKGKAYNIAFRYMNNESDALDVIQESFIKMFRHLPKFNGDSKFDTWAYRIVVNTCHDFLRKSKDKYRTVPLFSSEEEEEPPLEIEDQSPKPEDVLLHKEESAYIIGCLEKINSEHKEIIILRDVKGFSYEEIAEILECNIGTVKSRISRARNKLKEVYLANRS
ncbi:RNA polymerase sigma factor [Clostridium aminobutyricum]|uniref:Sigma-70 family RNA polymerase sigma factor n=1 Tax=Clostridium aminobutyricum TaxID=33953 RepID=A0A939D809_CLOAM|nr:sigma-70 family RNA polymerase sigma factor [Clostridium aminobutyricum]MBN7772428.1 sigma-70 family RNA polymerase sigma factor [Clostridium aminobutyricum]